MVSMFKRVGIVAAAAMSVIAISATAATAATTAEVNGFDQLEVVAGWGVNNSINIYPTGISNTYQVVDSADTVSAGAGCTQDSANSVTCGVVLAETSVWGNDGDDYISAYFLPTVFSARGGEGADTISGSGAAGNIVYGEGGDDTITGGGGFDQVDGGADNDTISGAGMEDNLWGNSGNDTINGGGAADMLDGGTGTDTLNGGDGDDSLRGGLGADVHNGDAGTDEATYSERSVGGGVTVSIDGSANDGTSGEGDNVTSTVENLTGTPFGDNLKGPTTGTVGNAINGGGAADSIYGYGGADSLTGGGSFDLVYGGDGNDTINSKDSFNDSTDCGAGTDTVNADLAPFDSTVTACETVNRS